MKLKIEGDGKGPASRVHLPLVLPMTPGPPLWHTLWLILFFPRSFGPLAVGLRDVYAVRRFFH
jgi:hypothetical protein